MNTINSQTVLLAGATGYLGGYIAKALIEGNYKTKLMSRSTKKIEFFESKTVKIINAEVNRTE